MDTYYPQPISDMEEESISLPAPLACYASFDLPFPFLQRIAIGKADHLVTDDGALFCLAEQFINLVIVMTVG